MSAGTCRVCNCTDDRACVGPDGERCSWVTRDLCSHCAGAYVVVMAEGLRPKIEAELNELAEAGYHVITATSGYLVCEHMSHSADVHMAQELHVAAAVAQAQSGIAVPGR